MEDDTEGTTLYFNLNSGKLGDAVLGLALLQGPELGILRSVFGIATTIRSYGPTLTWQHREVVLYILSDMIFAIVLSSLYCHYSNRLYNNSACLLLLPLTIRLSFSISQFSVDDEQTFLARDSGKKEAGTEGERAETVVDRSTARESIERPQLSQGVRTAHG